MTDVRPKRKTPPDYVLAILERNNITAIPRDRWPTMRLDFGVAVAMADLPKTAYRIAALVAGR